MTWSFPAAPFKQWRVTETKKTTLSLYRYLLRTANQYKVPEHQWFLRTMIKERFRFHQYNTSPKSILQLLSDANKSRQALDAGLQGNQRIMQHIDNLAQGRTGVLAQVIQKLQAIDHPTTRSMMATDIRSMAARKRHPQRCYRMFLPPHLWPAAGVTGPLPISRRAYAQAERSIKLEKQERRKQRRIRMASKLKAYQTMRTFRSSSGFYVRVIRGWRVPTSTAMAIKKRVKKNEQRLAEYRDLLENLQMLRSEQSFYETLGMPKEMDGYIHNHQEAVQSSFAKYMAAMKRTNPKRKKD
ncbi:hypothetical protein DM01DRAFT_1338429 [Hesseltinella vesiculosa]|uniref:Complex 1 LYR protein domain-containing protein n=1 Tax=Hesseltinella vesiculosa TaxID=101127 RepID=A0A1X2G9V7_9FUNG|nr:hypothetical protein DM01DRAFT_1338429 [Hesseltinella vesiculosa]